MNFKNIQRIRISVGRGMAIASLIVLGRLAATAQPFASPEGSWDVVQSGPRSGVAVMTFEKDFTITMNQIIVPKQPKQSTVLSSSRGDSGGRGGIIVTGGTNGLPAHTNLFGSISFPSSDSASSGSDGSPLTVHDGEPAGQWGFDTAGRVIGFWMEISAPSSITTNSSVVNLIRLTNAISFTGKVSAGSDPVKRRLALVCSTPDGKVTFSGLAPIQLTDLSGPWYGTEKAQGLPYNEIFQMVTLDTNFYSVTGSGPQYEDFGLGHTFDGVVLVSRRNKIGFVVAHPVLASLVDIRAVIGPINLRKSTFTGKGMNSSPYAGNLPVSYKGSKSPPLP